MSLQFYKLWHYYVYVNGWKFGFFHINEVSTFSLPFKVLTFSVALKHNTII